MPISREELLEVLDGFSDTTVAVAGDLLADLYVNARPVGLSREAPVMILKEESQWISPGGAANAACNVLALSGKVKCIGLVGDDMAGEMLRIELERRGADTAGVVKVSGAKTYTKTRVFAGDLHTVKQQVMRLDSEPADRMSEKVERSVVEAIRKAEAGAKAWLISDYDGDFLSEGVVSELSSLIRKTISVLDSHRKLMELRGVTCATPNEAEAEWATGLEITDDEGALAAGRKLEERMDADWVFLTRGNRGMVIIGREGEAFSVPIVGAADIVDVAGAGDTVAAVTALALAGGAEAPLAGILAAYAASIVCMKTGVETATPEEVRAAIREYPMPEMTRLPGKKCKKES